MAQVKAIDVSQWQGSIYWGDVKSDGIDIAIIKTSGGDAGLYVDAKAYANYNAAKSAGIAVGQYHFAGGQNATNEADFFIAAVSPLEQDDVLVLDWEVPHANPVAWCLEFVNRVHDRTGIWPMIYMNASTAGAYNWAPVFVNCGLWVAAWNNNPNVDVTAHTYVMHQYTSSGTVKGINGRVDLDMWFGTLAQFKKYGYQKPAPAPTPPPTPPPVVIPPTPPPAPPATNPNPTPTPNPDPSPPPAAQPKPEPTPYPSWFVKFFTALITAIKNILKKGQ